MAKHRSAIDNPSYRKFTKSKNQALEKLHTKMQQEISDHLSLAIVTLEHLITQHYPKIQSNGFLRGYGSKQVDALQGLVKDTFTHQAHYITQIILKKRGEAYTLSRVGETEALARISPKPIYQKQDHTKLLHQIGKDSPYGGKIHHRVEHSLKKIANKVNDAIHMSAIMEEDTQACLKRVYLALPRIVEYKQDKKFLGRKTLKEADQDPTTKRFAFGFIDNEEWRETVDDYLKDYKPQYKFQSDVFDIPDSSGDLTEYYGWEIEREMTQDFLEQVRTGQSDAAKAAGINDFIWVSVLDDRTDECCEWRNGLTLTEIEAKLNDEGEDEGCEGVNPPIHINCRCDLSPMVDDMPEQAPSNESDFDEWLNG